jgi:hypothetical protein
MCGAMTEEAEEKGERVFQPVDHGLESPCSCEFFKETFKETLLEKRIRGVTAKERGAC